jgi:hypothetical protein
VEIVSHATLLGALEDFRNQWLKTNGVLLVVDECDDIENLASTVSELSTAPSHNRLLVTAVKPIASAKNIPVSSIGEAQQQGRGALLKSPTMEHLGPITRELLTYIAISPVPLSAAKLIELRGEDGYSVERLADDLSHVRLLVDDNPRGFRVVHQRVSSDILAALRQSPQKCAFYTSKLAQSFSRSDDLKLAYEIACLANNGSERQYAVGALRQAIEEGDWRRGVRIAEDLLAEAEDKELLVEAFKLNLQLCYPLELMGEIQRADKLLDRAAVSAAKLGDWAQISVREVALARRVRRTLDSDGVNELEGIYRDYGAAGDGWNQARIGLELASLYMSAKQFNRAVELSRAAQSAFEAVGDDYGVELALRNLASSLIGDDADSVEGQELLVELEKRFAAQSDAERQRAWLCNVRARRLRSSGRYKDAQESALEAIKIADNLGDEYLRAINLINLGNALADDSQLEGAVEVYQLAGLAAQKCGRRDIEADSSRLSAERLNDLLVDRGYGKLQLASQAKAYAEHSLGLLDGSVNHYGRSRTLVELGRAKLVLGDEEGAGASFFLSARSAFANSDPSLAEWALRRGSHLTVLKYPDTYARGIAEVLEADVDPGEPLGTTFLNLIPAMVVRVPLGAVGNLLSSHLFALTQHLPEYRHDALAKHAIDDLAKCVPPGPQQGMRTLYASIAIAALLKESRNGFLFDQLSRVVSGSGSEVYAREEHDHTQLWTLLLSLGTQRLTITIASLDEAKSSQIACLALAAFIKAFEPEFQTELPITQTSLSELSIFVATYEAMPSSLKKAVDTIEVARLLDKQCVVVTRPTDFDGAIPTQILLSERFANEIRFGEAEGGALQHLFGLTLIELVYQLLRGQVDEEVIRPKVVSLVRRTI